MCGRVIRRGGERLLEGAAGVGQLLFVEALDSQPTFDDSAVRREERLQPGIGFPRRGSRDRRDEAIPAPGHRLDKGHLRCFCAEQTPKRRDDLLEAVVADGHVLPAGLNEVVLRHDLAGPRHEEQQHVELPIGDLDRFAAAHQAWTGGVELERREEESCAGGHRRIVPRRRTGSS